MSTVAFRRLSIATLVATLAVILWGAYVRASGSGAGCGSHWPLCNGEVLPRSPNAKLVVELTHRVTSGLSLILTVIQLWFSFRVYPRAHRVRKMAATSMFFMVTEAAVGAGLVLFEMVAGNKSLARVWWMSAHLINTYFLIASMALTAAFSAGVAAPRRGPRTALVTTLAVGMLAVGTSGAIVALGDTLFPSKSLVEGFRAELSTGAHLLIRLRVVHPVLALAVGALVALVARGELSRTRDPDVAKTARAVLALFVTQIAVGFLNLGLLAPIPLQIVHLLVADLLWIATVLFGVALLGATEQPAGGTAGLAAPVGPPSI